MKDSTITPHEIWKFNQMNRDDSEELGWKPMMKKVTSWEARSPLYWVRRRSCLMIFSLEGFG
jgi:hypothetical protein